MTEVEYVLSRFDDSFAAMRDKRILLHGSRNYAQAILERFGDRYHFVGVMSMDALEGDSWHGLPIFREEELQRGRVDLVILTERVKYAEAAFQAIRRSCRREDIRIYNMYGLDEFRVRYEASISSPMTKEEALLRCRDYDAVAFEVMDVIFPASAGALSGMRPSKTFSWLVPELRAQGKELRFSLRKSFNEEKQIHALKSLGFAQDDAELIRRRGEDLSFRALKESVRGEKILYFGRGLVNEFILPRCYGIDTLRCVGSKDFDIDSPPPETATPEKKPYSPKQREQLREEIRRCQLISFDVFDTLLLRKTLYPRDVFELTERRALAAGYAAEGFARVRAGVEDSSSRFSTLDQIYEGLAELCAWDGETEEAMKAMELSVERAVLEPRPALVELLDYALSLGKRVVLTSDMYLPAPVMREILEEKGIRGYEKIFVSCDCGQGKRSGLYARLLTLCDQPGQILHIGDHPEADGNAPKEYGITGVVIPSAAALARESGWLKPIETAFTLAERCLLGLTISRLFADPFQNPNHWELSIDMRMAHLGNSVVGPLMTGHLCWLIQKLRAERYDGVLFLARDGWLPCRTYERLRDRLVLPRGIYYYANRHSAFLCRADSDATADRVAEIGRNTSATVDALLENLFMVPADRLLPHLEGELDEEYIDRHRPLISEIAARARAGYLRYSEGLGMREGERFAVIDFIAVGNTQAFLSAALPYTLRGFYYGTYTKKGSGEEQIAFYLEGKNPALLHEYLDLENFFSSPEPSVSHMSEQGVPVFQKEQRDEQTLRKIGVTWNAAESYAGEFFDLFYQDGDEIAASLVEEMYAAITCLGISLSLFDDWFWTVIKKQPSAINTGGKQ